ncbi:MAG TPA: putative toxin-antitoxin system toxin component, PIN family [Candidatus Limnocylindrales bacterium]|nr:putative toxin-antitoxin system toxin component, PIN family [Candidatus Limnocylindrales bacterium]
MGKKVKVVFDTNVWISIFMEKRLRDEFLRVKQDLAVYIGEDIGLEISKVLQYQKVSEILRKGGISEKDILRILAINSVKVEPKLKLRAVDEDAEDNKILECALAARADIVVSGDKHLLKLGKFRKTRILPTSEFFESINK